MVSYKILESFIKLIIMVDDDMKIFEAGMTSKLMDILIVRIFGGSERLSVYIQMMLKVH